MRNKVLLSSFLLSLVVGFFLSCAGEKSSESEVVAVTGISLDSSVLSLKAGGIGQLKATIAPSDATNKAVTWRSSDEAVAKVSSTGEVTAISVGEATITVTSRGDKTKVATAEVTVEAGITGISLDSSVLSLKTGGTAQLKATIAPSEATNKEVTWTSSAEAVATVSSTGEVTAIGVGKAIITATSRGDTTKVATAEVTVEAGITGITLNKTALSLNLGGKMTLIATIAPSEASNKAVTWRSSDEAIATVSSTGEVTAISVGQATITATSRGDTTKVATAEITVEGVEKIILDKTSLSLNLGGKATLIATIVSSEASNKAVTWRSSAEAVATVSSTGEVTAISVGQAIITVASKEDSTKKATATVTVTSGATAPSSPATLTSAIKGGVPTTVVLSWTAPSDTGKAEDGVGVATITGYEITFTPTIAGITQPIALGAGIRSKEISGLTPAKTYTFTVRAKNITGRGKGKATQQSIASSLAAPGSPTALVATASGITTTAIPLTWVAPTNKGKTAEGTASSIKSYSISYTDGTSPKTKKVEGTGGQPPATSTTLTGLKPGTAYTITISATNTPGEVSGSSNELRESTKSAATKPGAPTGLAATASGITRTTMALTWVAPTDKGKNADDTVSSITKYTISYTTTGGNPNTKVVTGGQPPATSTTLTGLKPGTAYTITITATNTAGEVSGSSSELRESTKSAATKSGAPTALVATASGITTTTIPLTWVAPTDKGKNVDDTVSSIKSYTVSYTDGTSPKTKKVEGTGGQPPATSTTLTALTPGTAYTITVTATNTPGEVSVSSSELSISTKSAATKPGAPTGLAATASGITTTTVPLTWVAPTDKGKNADDTVSSITKYTISYTTTGGSPNTKIITATGGQPLAVSTTLTNLAPNTEYTIYVTATNTPGETSVSSSELKISTKSAATKPGAPTALAATASGIASTTIPLTWVAPTDKGKNADNTASSIKSYTVSYSKGGVVSTKVVLGTGGQSPSTSTTLTGLTPETEYTITVSATNGANLESGLSNQIRATTKKAPTPKDGLGALIYLISQSTTKSLPSETYIDRVKVAKTIFGGLKPVSGATVALRYVKTDGANTNNGESWSTAKKDIKAVMDGITDASSSKIYLVLIGSGTYKPAATLSMKNHVAIIGGFNASGDTVSGYDKSSEATAISGEDKRQVFNNRGLDVGNVKSTAVLSRVTVTKGSSSTVGGGGMSNIGSSPTITEVIFSANAVTGSLDSSGRGFGGGMYNSGSSPIITDAIFSNNSAGAGGGMSSTAASSPIVIGTTFSSNSATSFGGGVYSNYTSPTTLIRVTFSGNSSVLGGGMYMEGGSSSTQQIILMGVTFSDNSANSGGGLFLAQASPIISSTIFWGNTKSDKTTPNQFVNESAAPVFAHSIIQGSTMTTNGIIKTDPVLGALTANGGFAQTMAIGANSPAKDKGLYFALKGGTGYYSTDNTTWYTTPLLTGDTAALPSDAVKYNTDARGYSNSGRPDMGAYEYGGTAPSSP